VVAVVAEVLGVQMLVVQVVVEVELAEVQAVIIVTSVLLVEVPVALLVNLAETALLVAKITLAVVAVDE
jgi:hypothetical protein